MIDLLIFWEIPSLITLILLINVIKEDVRDWEGESWVRALILSSAYPIGAVVVVLTYIERFKQEKIDEC